MLKEATLCYSNEQVTIPQCCSSSEKSKQSLIPLQTAEGATQSPFWHWISSEEQPNEEKTIRTSYTE